ncbi:MAG: PorZ beta-propeller-like domain-containing protein, partial [Bacteroidia bacterium]
MKRLFILFFCFISLFAFSQPGIGPYSWQDHLSFNSANSIAKLGNDIYASNYNGLVKIDFNEFSTKRKNKINGLSDVGVTLLRTNENNNRLVVIYENCNIDVISADGNIQNYPDIKLKTLSGKKVINEVFFKDQYAYLACGFGIVVFDTEKLEVKDTYIIGPNGTNLEIYQVSMNDSLIFAATPTGLYKANYKTKILNNFNNWTLAGSLPGGPYSGVIKVNDKILAAYSPYKTDNSNSNSDTLYILNNNTWSVYPQVTSPIKSLGYVKGKLFTVIAAFGAQVWDINTGILNLYLSLVNGNLTRPTDLVFDYDHTSSMSFWSSDYLDGVYQTYGPYPYYSQNQIIVNGTNRNIVSNIDVFDGKVAVSPSYPQAAGGTSYIKEGVNILQDGAWKQLSKKDLNDVEILDIDFAYFDRKDKTRMWAGSWYLGLLEYKNDQLVAVYNATNTSMGECYPGASRCSCMEMDADGNLWISNSDNKKYLSVRKKDGSFQAFDFDLSRFTRKIIVDKNNYICAIHERDQGITVFKNSNFAPA